MELLLSGEVNGATIAAAGGVLTLLFAAVQLYRLLPTRATGIPEPPNRHWFWGHMKIDLENLHRLHDLRVEEAEKYGKELGAYAKTRPGIGRPPAVILTDVENVRHITETKFENYVKRYPVDAPIEASFQGELFGNGIFAVDGPEWSRQRKLYSYMFSHKMLKDHMFGEFESLTDDLIERLDKFAETGESFDIQELFCRLTVEGICRIAFGRKLDAILADEAPPFVKAFDDTQLLSVKRGRDFFWKAKRFLNIGSEREFSDKLKIMDDFVYETIRKIRSDNANGVEQKFNILNLAIERAKNSGQTLTDAQLRDIVLSFLIAGRDTTACALSWITYELARPVNEQVLSKVRSEIDQLESFDFREVEQRLPYLRAVMMEAQRMHPSVPSDFKKVLKEDTLPSGAKVKPGWILLYSPYVMGRLKSSWGDDVEEFKPTRFYDEETEREIRHAEAKFPQFNIGKRLCLGKPMAILETQYVIAKLLQRYDFQLDERSLDASYIISILLWIKGGLWVKVKRRV